VVNNQNKLMIILAGNAGHGKSTLEEMLIEIIEPWSSVRSDAYAFTLKKLVHDSLGAPWEILNAPRDVKESTLVTSWGGEEITVRQALQDVGEWFRQRFGHLIWANSVKHRAEFSNERVTIVTDARHPKEEIHWMRSSCSEFARIFVARIRRASVPVKRGHPSEDYIADEPDSSFDFIIENDGDLGELRSAALELACACVYLAKTGK
jgi:energy-coupling factor transporter ATP-binding protein EcfA2